MNAPGIAGATQLISGIWMESDKQALRQWELAPLFAARPRLDLARRYQQQYDRLDHEFANLRASESWLAVQDGEETARLLVSYVEVLSPYLQQRGLSGELVRWCEHGLRACETLQQNPAWLLLLRSKAQSALGRWGDASASIQAAIEASEGRVLHTYARAVLALGRLQLNQGDYRTALQTLSKAEELLSEQSDYEGLAAARAEFAAYYLNRRELDKALHLYLQVDQLRRQAGVTEPSDHTLLMLGVVYYRKGDYERTTSYLRQLLERSERQRNWGATATAAHHLAWVCLNLGDLIQARRLCGRAITLYEDGGDIRGLSDAYEQLGLIALAEGQKEEGLSYLEQSLVIRRQLGNQHGVASSLRRLAIAHLRTGKMVAAVRVLLQSLATYHNLGMLSRQRLAAVLREIFDWTVGRRRWTK